MVAVYFVMANGTVRYEIPFYILSPVYMVFFMVKFQVAWVGSVPFSMCPLELQIAVFFSKNDSKSKRVS
jgi:hypothetical protein